MNINLGATLLFLTISVGCAAAGLAWPAGIFAFYAGTHRRAHAVPR